MATQRPVLMGGTFIEGRLQADSVPGAMQALILADLPDGIGTGETLLVKLTDETTTLDNTLSNDADLYFSMEASKTYIVRAIIWFDCGDVGGADGYRYGLTGPAAPTILRWTKKHQIPGAASPAEGATQTTYTSFVLAATASGGGRVEIMAIIQNGVNAGTFAYQWAQGASDAATTTTLGGSMMRYKKIN